MQPSRVLWTRHKLGCTDHITVVSHLLPGTMLELPRVPQHLLLLEPHAPPRQQQWCLGYEVTNRQGIKGTECVKFVSKEMH